MTSYYVRYYGDEFALIRVEYYGYLNEGNARAYIFHEGKWKESPNHVHRILLTGDYDEITYEEAMKLIASRKE